jgi:hypothetical protein
MSTVRFAATHGHKASFQRPIGSIPRFGSIDKKDEKQAPARADILLDPETQEYYITKAGLRKLILGGVSGLGFLAGAMLFQTGLSNITSSTFLSPDMRGRYAETEVDVAACEEYNADKEHHTKFCGVPQINLYKTLAELKQKLPEVEKLFDFAHPKEAPKNRLSVKEAMSGKH